MPLLQNNKEEGAQGKREGDFEGEDI